jgi:hypothetical protein
MTNFDLHNQLSETTKHISGECENMHLRTKIKILNIFFQFEGNSNINFKRVKEAFQRLPSITHIKNEDLNTPFKFDHFTCDRHYLIFRNFRLTLKSMVTTYRIIPVH